MGDGPHNIVSSGRRAPLVMWFWSARRHLDPHSWCVHSSTAPPPCGHRQRTTPLALHLFLEELEVRRDRVGGRPAVLTVEVSLGDGDYLRVRRLLRDRHGAVVVGLRGDLGVREDALDERGGLVSLLAAAVS